MTTTSSAEVRAIGDEAVRYWRVAILAVDVLIIYGLVAYARRSL